jgi:hypothetical protein
MPGKPNSYLKSMIVDLPKSSKTRLMIEENEDLDKIVNQVRLEKQCLYKFDDEIQDGETGKELLCKFGFTEWLREANLKDRQEMYGFMIQIESVAADLAEDEDDED